ncbi:anti-sigma factor family protein [Kineococcus rhizosphaerae]|uniref:Putative zinc finger protein n=1 Tax=Kineococcus rhizosphaerae TaxID=559628 RepID=A0A2T0RA99_9ACTN|nr:zf-HC2 domain-containing protein [Kineococcus rhizosphaerae]PRY18051.1 putative zinc finger protein [Kineococcus rhizosphaerae]
MSDPTDDPTTGALHDPYETSAGAYVLGALSPSERTDFEHHLKTCPECRRAVAELAGLPGLLARTPREVVEALTSGDPAAALREGTGVPDTVLPALLRTVRRRRTTRRAVLTAGLVAAAALVATVATRSVHDQSAPAPAVAATPRSTGPVAGTPQTMDPLLPTPITATVALTEVGWGTKVDLVCAYAHTRSEEPYPYVLVVTGRDGTDQQIGTWTAVPGKDASLTGATSWTRRQIAAVEVRTTSGLTVLQLDET